MQRGVGWAFLGMFLFLATVPAHAAAKDVTYAVDAGTNLDGSMYFTPNNFKVDKGDKVTITVTNKDTNPDGSVKTPHDLAIFASFGEEEEGEKERAECPAAEEHEARKVAFEVCKETTATQTFTAKSGGVFAFICEVTGHVDKGMIGTFIVEGKEHGAPGLDLAWVGLALVVGLAWVRRRG